MIGIIALLISILLPALNRARQAANDMKCLSNLRQIGLATTMYAEANKGKLPLFYMYRPPYANAEEQAFYERVFADRIKPYFGLAADSPTGGKGDQRSVQFCPSVTGDQMALLASVPEHLRRDQRDPPQGVEPQPVAGEEVERDLPRRRQGRQQPRLRFGRRPQPGQAEETSTSISASSTAGTRSTPPPSSCSRAGPTPASTGSPPASPATAGRTSTDPTSGKFNYLFVDGHAAPVDPTELYIHSGHWNWWEPRQAL